MLDSLRGLTHGDNAALMLLALIVFVFLLAVSLLVALARVSRLGRRLDALTRGADGQALEATLTTHIESVEQATRRMDTLEQAVGVLQAQLPGCLQRSSVVRYDAFDDVGGEQSFSLALLDAAGNGFVLTGVYSRLDMRVYAKRVSEGRSTHALSQEEQRALHGALTA